jgi:DNA-directed RNA polymerase subunit RPC12/RpoP
VVPMVINCEECGSEDLRAIRCVKCGGEEFVKQKVSQISDESCEDADACVISFSNSNYEYACYKCGSKLPFPNPVQQANKDTPNGRSHKSNGLWSHCKSKV